MPAVSELPQGNVNASRAASVKRDFSSAIVKGGSNLPAKMIVHGGPGVGKTDLAAQSPDPVFIISPGENGIDTLMSSGQVNEVSVLPEVQQWEDVLDMIDWLTTSDHSFKTTVIDCFTGLDAVCEAYVVRTLFAGDSGPGGYGSFGAGERAKFAEWNSLLSRLDGLRAKRKMRLLLLGHTKVGNKKNPVGLDYGRFVPEMSDRLWERTFGWSDICFYASFDTKVDPVQKGATKGKVRDLAGRTIYTTPSAAWDAKNRHGLPDEIPMGESSREAWNNIVAAMKAAKDATKGAVE